MRSLLLVCLGLILTPGAALAQGKPKLQVADIRVGYPAGVGRETGERINHYKAGSWCPVYVDVQAGREGLIGTEGRIEIVVETGDADDVQTNYAVSVALEKLGPHEQFTVPTMARFAGNQDPITISLYYKGQLIGQQKKNPVGLDSSQIIYLTVGGRLMLGQAALRVDEQLIVPESWNDREHVASIDSIAQMPLHWFGYDGVDVVVLATGNGEFFKKLESADKRYLQALAEWVTRGGHLILSVGQNQEDIGHFPELVQLLPVNVTGKEKVPGLRMAWVEGNFPVLPEFNPKAPPPTVAKLERKPGRWATPLMRKFGEGGFRAGQELIVQGPAGLGRVTVVGFDLDQRPFIDWRGQIEFWKALRSLAWQRTAVLGLRVEEENPNNNMQRFNDQTPQLMSQLYAYLENFEEVPVISFGWVALFIFLYILVVGPLDYFFLKKVVKRLELTWITFPTVVLTISAIAYFTAYHIKGKDLRIRKVDVVDYDLTSSKPMLTGQTWFTLFSPRIQHYTVGIDPAPQSWVLPPGGDDPKLASTMVTWLGRPDSDRRNRGQSLFRRAYDYDPAATGLRGVPIQVWSTKSFTACWQAEGDATKPLFAGSLKESKGAGGNFLTGDITWLPGDKRTEASLQLEDAYLLYGNRVVKLSLTPGTATKINTENDPSRQEISTWFRNTTNQPQPQQQVVYQRGRPQYQQGFTNLDYPIRAGLFFEILDRGTGGDQNSGLRMLDQSWRLKNPGEAILLVRMPSQQDVAEKVAKQQCTASRLWLGKIPALGESPPELDGILRQDTYVRVYLPVETKE